MENTNNPDQMRLGNLLPAIDFKYTYNNLVNICKTVFTSDHV
jgi:hypothetical protein